MAGGEVKRHDYVFRVRHAAKQRLLMKALEEMSANAETPAETRAISEMLYELENLLGARRRQRHLEPRRRRRIRRSASGYVRKYSGGRTTR